MRVLVDTNIFLDYLLKREGQWEDAFRFFLWCRKNRNQTYVTSMSLRDIEYIAHKYCRDKVEANRILNGVYSLCSKVIGISADCAINAMFENYSDFEDELQVEAAKEAMLDAIVTNDVKGFENRGIAAFTPKQIIDLSGSSTIEKPRA